ncbi:MAG: DUF1295 domain-containing protein [Hyphomicrobiales bacterium]
MLLLSFFVTLLAFVILWAVHVPLKNAGVVDFYWGPGFAVIGLFYFIASESFSTAQSLFLLLICIWAARLSLYLISRFAKDAVEDRRYSAMRRNGGEHFWWRSLFKIFALQAVIMWIVASPLHVALNTEKDTTALSGLIIFGIVLFLAGLLFECVADQQLSKFKDANPDSDALLTNGLWSWSRHPNYFGEAVLWWGLGVIAYAISGSLVAFAGPAVLTSVMMGVSGVLTDKHMAESRKQKYVSYFQTTSALFPIPPGMRANAKTASTKKDRSAV